MDRRHDPLTEHVTLRDYFAAAALTGLCHRLDAAMVKRYLADEADGREAIVAFKLADAMLEMRDK